jgi:hypothetical protein
MRNLPFFLFNGLRLLPTLSALYLNRNDSRINCQQAATMAILSGWPRMLEKENSTHGGITLLDQGPVYKLAEFLRFGPSDFRATASEWWEHTCSHWAHVLDMVIALDTADTILMSRARARSKGHGIETHSDEWAAQFLARSRAAQQEVLDSMGTLKVVSLDTSRSSLDETVQFILSILDQQKKS